MFSIRISFRSLFLIFAAFAALGSAQPAAAQQQTLAPPEFVEWLPISESDRALKSAVVEKDAGAEILLWRVFVVDEYLSVGLQRGFSPFVRLKVFAVHGKEKGGAVGLPF